MQPSLSLNTVAMNEVNQKTLARDSAPPVVRKKFGKPPVKVACLQCRACRTRCDGKPTCSNCLAKDRTCTYTQSKRGGARIRKNKKQPTVEHVEEALSSPELSDTGFKFDQTELLELCQPAISNSLPQPFFLAQPGAGLNCQHSPIDVARFFDPVCSSISEGNDSGYGSPEQTRRLADFEEPHPVVRVYSSDEDILNAYYVYIHPYFPILPPPESHQVVDRPQIGERRTSISVFTSPQPDGFVPSSPLSLALSASLALIPHPDDPNPTSEDSILLRRNQAQSFAYCALESIENESELLYSSIQPSEALSEGPSILPRKPFHVKCPVENESVLALLILGTYEYAQRGNISKLRTRAGQALVAAMGLGLHCRGSEDSVYAEADRRAWWMTYILVCQGSILSNTSTTILLNDPRFTTPGPTFAADQEGWVGFLRAQQVIVSATQFVLDLEEALKTKTNYESIWDRMLELEAMIEPLIDESSQWLLDCTPSVPLDWCEKKVTQALRGMTRIKLNSARIKLHRYCAFSDIPVFTKKHCDLASYTDENRSSPPPICPCSSKYHQTIQSFVDLSMLTPPSTYTSSLSPPSAEVGCGILPFSSHFSAKVCMQSAFNIAESFKSLPLPDTVMPSPRMVPIFACCAMQSSYAMVMLCYKTKAMGLVGAMEAGVDSAAVKLLGQLWEGLKLILDALKNYSIAYEALGGMQDQVSIAADSVNDMQQDISEECFVCDGK